MAKDELVVGSSMFDDHYFIDPLLRNAWEEFKFRFLEKPYSINSVWRSNSVNDSVGGVPGSYHLKGRAIDVSIALPEKTHLIQMLSDGDRKIFSWMYQYNVCELIIYNDGHIHFAVDPDLKEYVIKVAGLEKDTNESIFRNFISYVEKENSAKFFLNQVLIASALLYIVFNFKYWSKS